MGFRSFHFAKGSQLLQESRFARHLYSCCRFLITWRFGYLIYKFVYSLFGFPSEDCLIFGVKNEVLYCMLEYGGFIRADSPKSFIEFLTLGSAFVIFQFQVIPMLLDGHLYSFAVIFKSFLLLIMGTVLTFRCYLTKLFLYGEQKPQLGLCTRWGSFCLGLPTSHNEMLQVLKILQKSWFC